jgi:hypothetical protein
MSDYQFNPSHEQWKVIPDYPGYEVSDRGRVRSYWKLQGGPKVRNNWILTNTPQKFMKIRMQGWGKAVERPMVRLSKDKKRVVKFIHRLVLETFIGPAPLGTEACHNDGNPLHNFLDNLRWDIHKNNQQDRIKHGTYTPGEKCHLSKLTNPDIIKIRALYQFRVFTYKDIAKLYNVHHETIRRIVVREIWKHI